MIVTRFAPSPNGPLHLGHAYSAIVAHDLATEREGRFLLRLEDIDGARSRPELAQDFRRDLEWLGLEWEEVPAQSTRLERYEAISAQILEQKHGLLFACRCTRAEIASAATGIDPDGAPLYPGTCRDLHLHGEIENCALRLNMTRAVAIAGALTWTDEIAGEQQAKPECFGDVVLQRKDAPASYHLAATIDDAEDGVTLVTRGADLFAASHIHRLLQDLLDLPVPHWHHHPLLLDKDGKKLSKSRQSGERGFGLTELREAGEDGRRLADRLRMGQMPSGITLSRNPHGGL